MPGILGLIQLGREGCGVARYPEGRASELDHRNINEASGFKAKIQKSLWRNGKASETGRWVRHLPCKSDDLISNPGIHRKVGEKY